MIVKGFNLYVIDSNDAVVEDLGSCPFVVLKQISDTFPAAGRISTNDYDYTYFSNLVDNPLFLGNATSDFWSGGNWFDTMRVMFPRSLMFDTMIWAGYRFKLAGNESGYYAISSTILNQGYALNWTCYDNNDAAITGSLSGAVYGFPMSDSASVYTLISKSIENDVLFGSSAYTIRGAFVSNPDTDLTLSYNSRSLANSFLIWFNALTTQSTPIPTDDPYAPGGTSTGGVGGDGTHTDSSDPIDFPTKPTVSALGTGFITIFNPSLVELKYLSDYMWTANPATLDFWKKIVADPMDLIIGLSLIPILIDSPNHKTVYLGGIDTEIDMHYADSQYVDVDCGSITMSEYWGAYLDYAPYTKAELYLPYCGTHAINIDDIMGKTIAVKYFVDILSGACVACVKCGDSVLYQFAGNCALQLPINAAQYGGMVQSVISIAASIGTMVATKGATAPMAVSQMASVAGNSAGLKPEIEKSGAIGGNAGLLGIQKPYLILTRPDACIPVDQNKYIGYPTYVTVALSDLAGFNVIDSIHIEGVPCTDNELAEIERLLKTGVIF